MKSVHFHGAWLGQVLVALSFFGAALAVTAADPEPVRGVLLTAGYNSSGQTGLGYDNFYKTFASPAEACVGR
ncbi:MAG: hypothetical protein IPL39_07990 [Opitutaceae bacterium]|nr:hypothetical protein [Opitutaceae bacterium]